MIHRTVRRLKKGMKKVNFEQDPVSTMQNTGLANYSSFLVWSGLEKGITYGYDQDRWQSTTILLCIRPTLTW